MLPTYFSALALMLLFLFCSSWIAYIMFEDTKQGEEVFTSYGTTLYQMFILFTTSNNPIVWIPAYRASRWYSIFFVLYILLGFFFITNLILSVICEGFKSEVDKQNCEKVKMREKLLNMAFRSMDKCNVGYLHINKCYFLYGELTKYRKLPLITKEEFESITKLNDNHNSQHIVLDEFRYLCDTLAEKFGKKDYPSCLEAFPIYNSPSSEKLKTFVRSDTFENIIVVILVIDLIAEIIETMLDIANSSSPQFWQVVECVLGWIYFLEMVLRIYTYGFMNYWRDGQNRFDFFITCVIVLGETTTFILPKGQSFFYNREWIRYLILARVLRLMRLLMQVPSYRAFVATFLTLIHKLMPYLGIIFCSMCVYSSLGVQIFGGIVNAGNASLEETDLAREDLLLFNFNDYPNAMVTTFNLLLMGSWEACMQTYKDLMRSSWTLAYFVSFYLITVLLILNVIIAFVLEAFMSELEREERISKDKKERERRKLGFGRFAIANKLLRILKLPLRKIKQGRAKRRKH